MNQRNRKISQPVRECPLRSGRSRPSAAKHSGHSLLRHLFPAVMLAMTLSLPSGVQADGRFEAAMAIVVPPDQSDVERLIEIMALEDDPENARVLQAQLLRLYRSEEFRQRTARVYAKYLSEDELHHLAETFQHPAFRRYREVAPEIMVELAALERDLFATMQP